MTQDFNSVATLIAAPEAALDDAVIARAKAVLPSAAEPSWLDPGIAADIPFAARERGDQRAIADAVRALFGDIRIDVVVQPATSRRKKLFLADMDSTMIGQECIDELADYVNLKAHVAAITERAMRGEIAFEPALRERVALLKGLRSDVAGEVIAQRVRLTPGGRTLVATMRANGARACLVSGGFTSFTGPIAAMIGFDENRGNTLLLDDAGRFNGLVQEPILGAQAKLATLRELSGRLGLAKKETLAIGDGANDLAMIAEAGLGVAFHAKPKVAAAAHARIDHCDLTALLYAQGYRREEFVER
jgi:phosphoserine phosphatase